MSEEIVRQHDYVVRHPNGRGVYLTILGARDFKQCVFYSHGFPACRYEALLAHSMALQAGLTILALDRPGYGGSDWYSDRLVEDWAYDVAVVAERFRIETFSILAVSGGTPTAVAAAALLPDKVKKLLIVSGVGPMRVPGILEGMNIANRAIITMGLNAQWAGRSALTVLASLWRVAPVTAKLWFGSLLPPADLDIVKRPEVGLVLARNIKEALKQGVRGAVSDFDILLSDWGSLLGRVQVPTSIWHGDADTYVPISMARYVHESIPQSTFHQVEGGGHFMIVDRLAAILECVA